MTNKNRRRRDVTRPQPRPASDGEAAAPAARPGLMASIFSARGAGTTNMPRVRTSLARGLVVTLSTPVLLIGTVAGVLLVWVIAIALGFQGPASSMASAMAMPPIGTYFDLQLATRIFRASDTGTLLLGALPFVVGRAIVVGMIVGIAVEVLETGRATVAGARRGLRVAPMVVIVTLIELGFLFVANIIGQIAGQGLSLFVGIAAIAGAVYLLGYAPVAQLRKGRGVLESLSRSSTAARIPGSSALAMALIYAIPSLFLQAPVGGVGVNPSPELWAFVLILNILHVSVIVTYAYRWMCIEDEVPEPAARRRARRD